jgi:hypothetical protein
LRRGKVWPDGEGAGWGRAEHRTEQPVEERSAVDEEGDTAMQGVEVGDKEKDKLVEGRPDQHIQPHIEQHEQQMPESYVEAIAPQHQEQQPEVVGGSYSHDYREFFRSLIQRCPYSNIDNELIEVSVVRSQAGYT